MIDYDSNKTKNRVIILMLVVLGIMITAVVTLAYRLDIRGPGRQEGPMWDIAITEIKEHTKQGYASSVMPPRFVGTYAEFYVVFEQIGDSYTYELKVANNGMMDAKVDSVICHDNRNNDLVYEITGIKEKDVLKSGEEKTIYVKVSYITDDEVPQEQYDRASIYINFVQDM